MSNALQTDQDQIDLVEQQGGESGGVQLSSVAQHGTQSATTPEIRAKKPRTKKAKVEPNVFTNKPHRKRALSGATLEQMEEFRDILIEEINQCRERMAREAEELEMQNGLCDDLVQQAREQGVNLEILLKKLGQSV